MLHDFEYVGLRQPRTILARANLSGIHYEPIRRRHEHHARRIDATAIELRKPEIAPPQVPIRIICLTLCRLATTSGSHPIWNWYRWGSVTSSMNPGAGCYVYFHHMHPLLLYVMEDGRPLELLSSVTRVFSHIPVHRASPRPAARWCRARARFPAQGRLLKTEFAFRSDDASPAALHPGTDHSRCRRRRCATAIIRSTSNCAGGCY
jgi:hypothetical protein